MGIAEFGFGLMLRLLASDVCIMSSVQPESTLLELDVYLPELGFLRDLVMTAQDVSRMIISERHSMIGEQRSVRLI